MRPIAPRLVGYDEITVAEDQPEYMPLAACILAATFLPHADGSATRVCRWTFTPEERKQVAAGADIYFGSPAAIPLTPHWFTVGPPCGTTSEDGK